ncbi:copper chaperone PCu(A)C [Maricaulis parjimensis]|uniref:copper chaperone PCu(A)C n=1 Tax=Maricaulis parjimensis TaxID=144023 RepID=UPI001939C4DE|nr:copper chaperone PCu(A)C [Maricaulis parjimensis]
MRFALILTSALMLTACGGHDDHAAMEGEHAAMDHGAMAHDAGHDGGEAELAPLPDDGVMPVVDVTAAWMRPHPQGRDVTAAYFTARLAGGSADRLVAARIEGAASVELHGHTMNDQGMMQMRAVGPQTLEAGDTLVFAPGGLHLMVFGLAPVVDGDTVEGVLVFERSGEIPVRFAVGLSGPSAD